MTTMQEKKSQIRHERHGLVLSLWIAFGFLAVICIHLGLSKNNWIFSCTGFLILIAGFMAHIIVNAIAGTGFHFLEAVFGLFVFSMGIVLFLLSLLMGVEYSAENFIAICTGLMLIFISISFYMITRGGVHKAFEHFNVIKSFHASSMNQEMSEDKER